MRIITRTFYVALIAMLLVETTSFFGHFFPMIAYFGFFAVAAIFAVASMVKIEYGFGILLAEILIGSFGRLFSVEIGGQSLSLRMAFWFLFLLIWFVKELSTIIQRKKIICQDYFPRDKRLLTVFAGLFFFIAWGIVVAFVNDINPEKIFADFNAWAFFALLFPFLSLFNRNSQLISTVVRIFFVSVLWLSFKTIALLYLFSHNFNFLLPHVYVWVRDTRIGELTRIDGGFTRIFFQSHIFVLAAVFVFAGFLLFYCKNFWESVETKNIFSKKFFSAEFYGYFILLALSLAVNLLAFSRSNWIGLAIGSALFAFVVFFTLKFAQSLRFIGLMVASFCLGYLIIIAVARFPFPGIGTGFNTGKLLSERAVTVKNEAGVSSRWALLPELWSAIKEAPIIGHGFGTEVTYRSSDPRVLEKNPDGLYTTYAFEWGWLDIWLKLGLFGVLSYLGLIFLILYDTLCPTVKNREINSKMAVFRICLAIGLAAIAAVSFFSPYLNHPLGVVYLLLVVSLMETS